MKAIGGCNAIICEKTSAREILRYTEIVQCIVNCGKFHRSLHRLKQNHPQAHSYRNGERRYDSILFEYGFPD
jgi:hypothetical protein